MSPSRFLANLWQRGVVLRLSDDRSRIMVRRSQLTPELREQLVKDKPAILQLLALGEEYRALIRNAFAVMVDSTSARSGLQELADDQARLTDELGARLAGIIRDSEARQWRQETGLCPVCGDEESCDLCLETDQDDTDD